MRFYQPLDGYCYNSDTLFLYDFIVGFKPKGKLLDVGCGCGVLGLLLARDLDVVPVLVEISKEMAFLAQKNIETNKIDAKLIEGDFLSMDFKNEFDCIVSNPPFYGPNLLKSKNKSLKMARYNENMPIEPFFKSVANALKNKGDLFFCYDAKQLGMVLKALSENNLNAETIRFVHPKKDKSATIFLCHAKKCSKSALKIVPPLYVFDNGSYTNEANDIFKRANTHSIKCEV